MKQTITAEEEEQKMVKALGEDIKEVEVSDWTKDRVLGEGCFGLVLLGVPTKPNLNPVAIKLTYADQAYSLNKEALILSKFIGSPHILQLIGHQVTVEDNANYSVYNLVLEYAAGGSLDDLINQRKKLPEHELKGYLRMMLTGLSCIHSKGFVHCDFKPSNLLVFPSLHGKPDLKIADFGLSKKYTKEQSSRPRSGFGYKLSFRGTPEYMSPESFIGEITPSLDIWSLGCVLINMVGGKSVWNGEFNGKYACDVSKLVNEMKTPTIPKELSGRGKDFLQKCFQRDPKQRWSAEMLLQHPYLVEENEITEL